MAKADGQRGPLFGITIAVKDNIETSDMPTTAGSLALTGNVAMRDAPIVARLRAAGAIIVGKTNLSEWANFRSSRSISGWSAVGGLVRNPYALDRSACGSSSGSAVAVAVGIARVALGTETDGSIICPASMNGVVGFKPTMGLVSRRHIVPISPEQDTAGPIALTVSDAATVLTVVAGADPGDPVTAEADSHKTDYSAALDRNALRGARIGVLHGAVRGSPQTDAVFEVALAELRASGAVLVEVHVPGGDHDDRLDTAEGYALKCEFKGAINAYLAASPAAIPVRSLDQLIAFNAASPRELALFGQETFEISAAIPAKDAAKCADARALARKLAGPEGLDAIMKAANVDIFVAESTGPASLVDPVNGTRFMGSPTTMPAIAGYPHLTVPMGQVQGLPVGLSFIGKRWADARVLSLGYAFEQAGNHRRAPGLVRSISTQVEMRRSLAPSNVPAAR